MDDVGVYVHVPFCERVCPYCDFPVVAARSLGADTEARYVAALRSELDARRETFAGRRLATVYLGGGTPSLLRPESVAAIIGAVRDAVPGAPEEVTLEVNPSTVERARLPGFRSAGVDRVSVGVQSFDDTTLRRLGRAHRAGEAWRTLEACRDAGFRRLSLDLIAAAPGQDAAGLERDLDAALGVAPDHLSVYELTLEEATPFGRAAARGALATPGEDAAARMLERVEERLVGAGYRRYEISSYARPGCEAVHNRRYWTRRPVLGLGMGAVSTDPPAPGRPHGARRTNPRRLDAWLAVAEEGAAAEEEVLSPEAARGEAVFLALRTEAGLESEGFAAEFGGPPRRFFGEAIDEGVARGLLREGPGSRLRLTPRGRALADTVSAWFV